MVKLLVATVTVHTHEVIRCWTTLFLWDEFNPRSQAFLKKKIQMSVVCSEFQNGMQWLMEENFCNLRT